MKYFLKEEFLNDDSVKNAGNKARDDVEKILISEGYQPLVISVEKWLEMNLLKAQIHKYSAIKRSFKQLQSGDELLIQVPMIHHSLLFKQLLSILKKKQVSVKLLIHDLELLRFANADYIPIRQKIRMHLQEGSALREADSIIAHNEIMKSFLVERGISGEKIVSLGIFDYLIPDFQPQLDLFKDNSVIVAGNLATEKAGYLYELPTTPDYNLYGVGFEEDRALINEHYFGSFLPDELPSALQGSFGLIWDGDSSQTCSGVFGDYLRYNNPHKTSLYLASGFPVVVWKQSAIAQFVLQHKCGIAVDSLDELQETIDRLSETDYQQLVKNARMIGEKIREGYYLITALNQ